MEIRIQLPGVSPTSDRSLAPLLAAMAVADAQQTLPPPTAQPNASNACASDPHCRLLGIDYDSDGNAWLVYNCEGVIKAYPV